MNTILKGIAGAALLASATTAAHAAEGSGTAVVDIVSALTVAETAGLNFGNIVPPTAGTSTVTVSNSADNSASGSVADTYLGGANRATFSVSGTANKAIQVSNPVDAGGTGATNTVTMTAGSNSLTAALSLNTPTSTVGTVTDTFIGAGGSYTFYVGGQLAVPAGASEGDYSGGYSIDVVYQ